MPGIAILGTPDLLHDVTIRGMEPRRIFKDDKDRENSIERLSALPLVCGRIGNLNDDLPKEFDITPAALSYSVHRDGKVAKEGGYQRET